MRCRIRIEPLCETMRSHPVRSHETSRCRWSSPEPSGYDCARNRFHPASHRVLPIVPPGAFFEAVGPREAASAVTAVLPQSRCASHATILRLLFLSFSPSRNDRKQLRSGEREQGSGAGVVGLDGLMERSRPLKAPCVLSRVGSTRELCQDSALERLP